MRYDGFISYSHAADGQLAPALQKALQKLAKPWFRRRSLEIFRDETGLSVDPHLWGAIVKALDDSEWFLLLTSPLAAQSEWVGREIEHWKANRSVDRILPVVTDGHWEWDEKTGDFTADSDAVPAALRGVFSDEPRHLDLRWAHDEQQVDLNNSRFRNAVAEIAAPLHGVSKDEIEGEDVRQHRRTVRVAWSAAASLAVLTVAAVVAGLFAVNNANRAEQRRVQAEAQRLAAQSQTELERPDLAFLLAAEGYRLNQNAGTTSALLTSVANLPEVKERIPTDEPVAAVVLSAASDRLWVGTTDGEIVVYRFSDGEQLGRANGIFNREVVAMAKAGVDTVVATDGTVVTTVDGAGNAIAVRSPAHAVISLAVEPATGRIAAGTLDGKVLVWAPGAADPAIIEAGPGGDEAALITAVGWTPDGALLAASEDGGLRRYNLDAPDAPVWEQEQTAAPGAWTTALVVTDDGTVVTGASDGTVGFWNAANGQLTEAGLNKLHLDEVRGLALTGDAPAGGSVASVAEDGALLYWNHLTGESPLPPVRVDERGATAVAWDPADPDRGVTGGQEGGVVLFDYGENRRRPLARTVDGWDSASTVALSPTGDRLAVVRDSGLSTAEPGTQPTSDLVLTKPDDPDPDAPSIRIDGLVESLTFTPNGELVLAGTDHGSVVVWDGATPQATVTPVAAGGVVNRIAVSPDGTTVATGSVDTETDVARPATLRLWRFDGDKLVEKAQIDSPATGFGLAFTHDGSRLIVGGANQIAIHPIDGSDAATIDLEGDMTRSIAVSPDGKTLAVGLWSGPVRLFDMETGKTTGDDLRVGKRVTGMEYRENGDELVTVSADGSFILWDLASRSRLSDVPLVVADSNPAVQSTPSLGLGPGFAVTTAFPDGRLEVWSLDPDDWIAEGCRVHKRELSDAEKDRYDLEGSAPVCPE